MLFRSLLNGASSAGKSTLARTLHRLMDCLLYTSTGDTLWFGADGGYSFISSLAEDNKLAVQSLAELERCLLYTSRCV